MSRWKDIALLIGFLISLALGAGSFAYGVMHKPPVAMHSVVDDE